MGEGARRAGEGLSVGYPSHRPLLLWCKGPVGCYSRCVSDVTGIWERISRGEPQAAEDLWRVVYEELRKIAAFKMGQAGVHQTLQPTALVHEAWLRLGGDTQPAWKNRAHFFTAAAEAMRRILVERARSRAALKRGGGAVHLSAEEIEIPIAIAPDEELLAVDEALEKLARVDPRKAELVKLRYFSGLTFEQAAEVLDIAVPTAKEWWAYARAWLSIEIRRSV